ncbi:MAG: phosphatase PAP2 family protein [Tannerella sp.]|nr:phosphatase PAP2 family protein [Tannerella sp.]
MLEHVLDIERNAFLWLNGGHTLYADRFFWLFSGKFVWIPLAVWILFVLCRRKDWRESLLIILFIVLVITVCDQFASSICKPLFARFRPTHHPEFMNSVEIVSGYRGGLYGFISSHAANAFGFAVFTILLFRYRWYTVAILLWSICFSYSRIYLGVHFISDIISGMAAGALFGWLGYRLYVTVRHKFFKRTEDASLMYTKREKQYILYGLFLTVLFVLIYSKITCGG